LHLFARSLVDAAGASKTCYNAPGSLGGARNYKKLWALLKNNKRILLKVLGGVKVLKIPT
jgi:uncharacterized protein YabN with tetrapyrrole methylase and pyrophosphatase domain